MSKLRVHSFTISLDGYGAGANQSLDNPLGVGGEALHDWAFTTRTFRQMHDSEGGKTGIDDDFAARGSINIGAWIMGRTCSAPSGDPGSMTSRGDGGETLRRSMRRCLS